MHLLREPARQVRGGPAGVIHFGRGCVDGRTKPAPGGKIKSSLAGQRALAESNRPRLHFARVYIRTGPTGSRRDCRRVWPDLSTMSACTKLPRYSAPIWRVPIPTVICTSPHPTSAGGSELPLNGGAFCEQQCRAVSRMLEDRVEIWPKIDPDLTAPTQKPEGRDWNGAPRSSRWPEARRRRTGGGAKWRYRPSGWWSALPPG